MLFLGAHYRVGSPTSVQETIDVTQVIYHSRFNFSTLKNDVALLKLAKPITPSYKVNTVCLPKNGRDQISPGKNCFITGKAHHVQSHDLLRTSYSLIFFSC